MRGLAQAGYGDRWAAAVFDPISAIVGGSVISGGLGLIGSGMQSSAVSDAANQARADLAPWRTTGVNALNQSADLLGLNGPDAATKAMGTYQTSPGYQFQMTQGLRAVDAGAASQGLLRSGATLKAEQAFGQGLADSDFGNYYNRLMGLSQQGQSSAAGQASVAQNQGTQQAGIFGNTAAGLGNIATNAVNQSIYSGAVNNLLGGAGSGGVVDDAVWSV